MSIDKWSHENLGFDFDNKALITAALTHPSKGGKRENIENYERLEFLGDTVINLIVTEMLVTKFTDETEGDLAKRRATMVNTENLSNLAKSINIDKVIILGISEIKSAGHENKRILENAFEAVMGAIYLEKGFEFAKSYISKLFFNNFDKIELPPQDQKTFLQEVVQKRGLPIPTYKIINKTGSDHAPVFTIELSVQGFEPIRVIANSRKIGEKLAATEMLKIIK